jgi:putative ABC transport system substrate-binding protein
MKRREFIAGLSGAALIGSNVANAQQGKPVVGYLMAASHEPSELIALEKGLGEIGYSAGRNVSIEYHIANNNYDRLKEMAADLANRRVAVIFAAGGVVAARAAKAVTQTIPIVGALGGDPVAAGLVESLNRPGGNFTGIAFLTTELGPKRLQLLQELIPAASRYALLVNPENPATAIITAELLAAAVELGKTIEVFMAKNSREVDGAFAEVGRKGSQALIVGASSLFVSRRVQIATLAAVNRLPAIYYDRKCAEVGGLMSYGADIAEATRQAAIYAGRILKGEKPSELPVIQMAKFEIVINLQTAKALGITVPATLLARADEVIE